MESFANASQKENPFVAIIINDATVPATGATVATSAITAATKNILDHLGSDSATNLIVEDSEEHTDDGLKEDNIKHSDYCIVKAKLPFDSKIKKNILLLYHQLY